MIKIGGAIWGVWGVITLILGGISGMGGNPPPFHPFGEWLTTGMVQSAVLNFVFAGFIPLGVISLAALWIRDKMG